MTAERIYHGHEVRAEGRRLVGPAIRYGEVSPSHRERFEAGAFALSDGRTPWLDVAHDRNAVIAHTDGGGLELSDGADALLVSATLPAIPAAEQALAGVRSGLYRGFSVEFDSLAERRESGLRVIERAALAGVGLVSDPSYRGSTAELRGAWKKAAMQPGARKRWARSQVPVGKTMDCECVKPVDQVNFREGAFDAVLKAVETGEHVVQAVIGNTGPHNALGTTATGALSLAAERAALNVQLSRAAAETPAGRSLLLADANAPAVVRPLINHDLSVFEDIGGIRFYSAAWLAVLLFKSAPNRRGWEGIEYFVDDPDADPVPPPERRRRRWR